MQPFELWTTLGGRGDPPAVMGTCKGPLLILGGGRCVWEDYDSVRPWKGEIMAVNDIGAHFHEVIRHWCSLHPEFFPGWRTYREKHNYGQRRPPICHSHRRKEGVDRAWEMNVHGGTGGLFACLVAFLLGYDELVLGGIPMDNSGHYFDAPWYDTPFSGDKAINHEWQWAIQNIFEGRVTSLSGNTRKWLGSPPGMAA